MGCNQRSLEYSNLASAQCSNVYHSTLCSAALMLEVSVPSLRFLSSLPSLRFSAMLPLAPAFGRGWDGSSILFSSTLEALLLRVSVLTARAVCSVSHLLPRREMKCHRPLPVTVIPSSGMVCSPGAPWLPSARCARANPEGSEWFSVTKCVNPAAL